MMTNSHNIIASDQPRITSIRQMLEGYESPAILVSKDYEILATNSLYESRFGEVDLANKPNCFAVSHGYKVPCHQAGEDCPLEEAQRSGHKERVLHIHQTPRGKEHVDVEMLPIFDDNGELSFFVELLHSLPTSAETSGDKMVGRSDAFNKMLSKISRVSQSDAAVLLLGESGTGKELIAQAVHNSSPRADKPLVTLECSGLTEALFESELFGHVKGAFTGANNNKAGLIELAHGGTLFLDEVGDIPLAMQVKLLRLIETGTYRPVGSVETRISNFRLICATHKNIAQMVEQGAFRQDLFYRINVFPVAIPALRDRKEDLSLLCESLLKKLTTSKAYYLTDSAMKTLHQYHFPGNIRELRNILNRALVLTDTNLIEAETIRESIDINVVQPLSNGTIKNDWVDLKEAEIQYLNRLLEHCDNDKEAAAKIAGISVRSLYRKLSIPS